MARYTGPATRKSRRLGVDLVGGDQSFEKRPYPPGQHGRARIKESEYRQQLQEKQKARFSYGVMEKQFRRSATATSPSTVSRSTSRATACRSTTSSTSSRSR
jgi:small subunit ribosomal protein S4